MPDVPKAIAAKTTARVLADIDATLAAEAAAEKTAARALTAAAVDRVLATATPALGSEPLQPAPRPRPWDRQPTGWARIIHGAWSIAVVTVETLAAERKARR
jgi:hypothetical protein